MPRASPSRRSIAAPSALPLASPQQAQQQHLVRATVGGAAVYGSQELVARFHNGGVATEKIEVPTPNGTTVDRALRAGPAAPYAAAVAKLGPKFQAQGLTLASHLGTRLTNPRAAAGPGRAGG